MSNTPPPTSSQPIPNLISISEPGPITNSDLKAKLEAESIYASNNQSNITRTVLHQVFIWFIKVMSVIAITVISIRLVHLVLPSSTEHFYLRQWLTSDQIQGIDKLFFSGAIGGFIGGYFKKNSNLS